MSPPDTAIPMRSALDLGLSLPPIRKSPQLPPDLFPPGTGYDTYRLILEGALARVAEAEQTIAAQQERIDYLETLSLTDELTGLVNRRGFREAFRRELAAARRSGVGGVLVMIDLDGFKAINDTHGHLAGDAYLRRVGRVLTESVRAQDVVARLGGDEFAILLTGVDPTAGAARAARLADAFNAGTCEWQGRVLPLRASFGSHAFGPGDREEVVTRRADATMYQAKAGRRTVS
jgi:diguanylate cyclase (GGDEF)-like protein